MKFSLLLVISALLAWTTHAQSLPITFESDITTGDFIDFEGGVASVIANPQKQGINTSDNVGQLVRNGGAVFAGSKLVLGQPIDFSTMSAISMKVFTNAPVGTNVTFKIEAAGAGLERPVATTVSGEWETLTFDFTGVPTQYNEIVFLFDLGRVGDGSAASTFLFDDIEQAMGPDVGFQLDFPVTFESPDTNYALTDFGGNASSLVPDPTDASNTVAQVIRTANAETFAGTTIGTNAGFATNVPLTLESSKMNVRVWSPTAQTVVRLKLEDSNDPTRTVETETLTTVASQWETLEFDFANEATGTASLADGLSRGWTYNKASIFFNFGAAGAPEQIYYFDDVRFGASTVGIVEARAIDLVCYPNPALATWNLTTTGVTMHAVELRDIQGRLLQTTAVNGTQVQLEAAALPAGNYVATVFTDGGMSVVRLVRGM